MFGTSPATAYVESTSGVAAGGRTGLTSVVVAILFGLSMFFFPVVQAIADLPAITSPILIIVGCFMMEGLARINFKSFYYAFPSFAIFLTLYYRSSILSGHTHGFFLYSI